MKKSELKKLVSEYRKRQHKQTKKHTDTHKLSKQLKELEHRYFHETGRTLNSDLKSR